MWNKNLILKVKGGSHAYGLNTEKSDLDIRGICIANKINILGLENFEQHENKQTDTVIYELKKFVRLAKQCNPNVIEILFADPSDIIFINDFGRKLIDNRELFLTKAARYRFAGYAFAQLERIRRHKKWIDNPPLEPNMKNFTHKVSIIKKEFVETCSRNFGAKILINTIGRIKFAKFFHNEYTVALKEYRHYKEWVDNRNAARHVLEEKYNYDTKHAMHLMRLLRMGCEIMEGKGVIVKRPDKDYLLDVRSGKYSYDEILTQANELDAKLNILYEKSTLPHSPDTNKINELVIKLFLDFWAQK